MPVDPRIQRVLDNPLTSTTDLRFKPVKGYVQPPGTGPDRMTCRSCRHAVPTSCSRWQHICALVRDRPITPIKLETAACGRWEQPS